MEILVDASLAERAKALVDRVSVAKETRADGALQERVQRLLLDLLDVRGQILHEDTAAIASILLCICCA